MDINCPLCDEKATSKPVDHGNYFKFGCGFCGDHVISEIAAKRLQNDWLPAKQTIAEEAIDATREGLHLDIHQIVKDDGPQIEINVLSRRQFNEIK